MSNRKVVYQESYKPGSLRILRKELLPTVPSANGYEVIECDVIKAGRYDDGTEFQHLVIVLQEQSYAMMSYRNDDQCTNRNCYCKVLKSPLRTSTPLHPCSGCGCTWDDEPTGAGRDIYGRPDPRTHPEFWTE